MIFLIIIWRKETDLFTFIRQDERVRKLISFF